MHLHETWVGIGGSKLTAIFSASPSTISVPPQSRIYNDVLDVKMASQDAGECGDLWLAVTEEQLGPGTRRTR
jgi:hypothetical protein